MACINDGFRSRADERPTDLKSVPLNHSGTLTVYGYSPPASHDLDSNQGPTDLQSAALPLRHRELCFIVHRLWLRLESNQGPHDLQSCALPTKLRSLCVLESTDFGFAWSRTKDLTIFSRALSQLSYEAFVFYSPPTLASLGVEPRTSRSSVARSPN